MKIIKTVNLNMNVDNVFAGQRTVKGIAATNILYNKTIFRDIVAQKINDRCGCVLYLNLHESTIKEQFFTL